MELYKKDKNIAKESIDMINIIYNTKKQARLEKIGKVTHKLKQNKKRRNGTKNMVSEEKTPEKGTMCTDSRNGNRTGNKIKY